MLARYGGQGAVWIDLERPTREEVDAIALEFGLDQGLAERLALPSSAFQAPQSSDYLVFMLRFPAVRHSHTAREQEIVFLLGRSVIITAHNDLIDPVHKFAKEYEAHALLADGESAQHAVYILHALLRKLYGAIEYEIEFIRKELTSIEERIFADRQVEMVHAISHTARNLLNLRQTIEPHRDELKALGAACVALFGEEFAPLAKSLEAEYYRVHNHIMRHSDFLHELRETNNSLLTTKQNETMRIFTIMAFLTFPLALITAVLGIDFPGNPLQSASYGFWVIVGVVLAGAALMLWYFRKKGWL